MFLNKKKLPSLVKKSSAMPMPGALKSKFLPHGTVTAVKDANDGIIPKPTGMPPPSGAPLAPGMPPPPAGDIEALLEQAAQAAEGASDPELEDLLVDYMHGDMTAPPQWATDPAMWTQAAQAVGLGQGDKELAYEEPYVVAAYLYKMMGGPVTPTPVADVPMGTPADQSPAAKPPTQSPGGPMQKPMRPKPALAKPGAPGAAPPAKPGAMPPKPGAKPGAAPPPKPGMKPGAPPAKPGDEPHDPAVRGAAGKLAAAKRGAAKPGAPGAPPAKPGAGAPPAKPAAAPGAPPPADNGNGDIVEQAVQAAQTPDPDIAELAASYDPERDGNPPSWATEPDIWAQAEAAVQPRWAEFDQPWMVVAHAYKLMGGNVGGGGGEAPPAES